MTFRSFLGLTFAFALLGIAGCTDGGSGGAGGSGGSAGQGGVGSAATAGSGGGCSEIAYTWTICAPISPNENDGGYGSRCSDSFQCQSFPPECVNDPRCSCYCPPGFPCRNGLTCSCTESNGVLSVHCTSD
jgi:hypothetical protein